MRRPDSSTPLLAAPHTAVEMRAVRVNTRSNSNVLPIDCLSHMFFFLPFSDENMLNARLASRKFNEAFYRNHQMASLTCLLGINRILSAFSADSSPSVALFFVRRYRELRHEYPKALEQQCKERKELTDDEKKPLKILFLILLV